MDSLAVLAPVVVPMSGFFLDVLRTLWAVGEPAIVILIPTLIAAAAHRFVRNRELGDAIASAAGTAYNHLAQTYAAGGKVDLQAARSEAVAVSAHLAIDLAMKHVGQLGSDQLKARIDGQLGQLLAADPSFKVTSPLPARQMAAEDVATVGSLIADQVRKALLMPPKPATPAAP